MREKNSSKKISIFYFLIFLIVTSVILVIYINNIIYINQLAVGNNDIREMIKHNMETNDLLRTETERLSSFERIKSLAAERFNLSYKENSVDEKDNIIIKKSQLK